MERTLQRLLALLLIVLAALSIVVHLPPALEGNGDAALAMIVQAGSLVFFAAIVWKYDYLLKMGSDGRPHDQD